MNKPNLRGRVSYWLASCLMAALFAGCSTMTVAPAASPEQIAAITLLEQGQSQEAAQRLESLAALATGSQRSALLADAAFAWHSAGDTTRARALMPQVHPHQLAGASKARYALLTAELALVDGQPADAFDALDADIDTVPAAILSRWQLARAAALEATHDTFGAAMERAHADAQLAGPARAENQRAIERLLARLDAATLGSKTAALPLGHPLYNFAGHALLNRGMPLPRPFDRGEQWRFDAGDRPAADHDGYRPPVKLAVLLPLSGTLATAAAPVRDGLLAGYYGESRRRPEIDFYDTAGTAAGAIGAYGKAVAAGADFIVGPLGRDEVSAVFGESELPVPMLALNRGVSPPPPGSAGFSLAPEDDGIMAAEYLLSREHRKVLVIGSDDDSGKRAVGTFRERFAQRGGTVVATISVTDALGNIGTELQNAGPVDAIFLALKGSQARAVAPQLANAGLAGHSRVATSQLTIGTGKPEQDSALDGIVFPTEAWLAYGIPALPPAAQTSELLPTARGPASRLFAFGFDAWKITAYLERLATRADGELQGATGTLRLDGFGNIVRTPAWSIFSSGRPMPIAHAGR